MMLRDRHCRRLRLVINPPYPDESISSILDRACSLYHMGRHSVVADLLLNAGYNPPSFPSRTDWDNPEGEVTAVLAEALRVDVRALAEHAIVDGPAWLAPRERFAYCPYCMQGDLDEGRSPYFRRRWAFAFVTFCEKHLCPLLTWSDSSLQIDSETRVLPMQWQLPLREDAPTEGRTAIRRKRIRDLNTFVPGWQPAVRCKPTAQVLTERLAVWERQVLECVARDGDLTDSTDPHLLAIGRLLTALAANMGPHAEDNRNLGVLRVSLGRWAWEREPVYRSTINGRAFDRWTAFRNIGSPARRRAALCVTACTMEAGWPVDQIVPHMAGIESGSAEWWHWVIMPRQDEKSWSEFDAVRELLSIPSDPPRPRNLRRRVASLIEIDEYMTRRGYKRRRRGEGNAGITKTMKEFARRADRE